jgi:putative intracellular protease/amidase
MHQAGRTVAAICAAPLVLQDAGILDGRAWTCHPEAVGEPPPPGYREEDVVEDGNLVTSRGPGTAFAFALTLIARHDGATPAAAIRRAMVLPPAGTPG